MGITGRIAARLTRQAYARERIPERVLWWLSAAGMRDWYRVLDKRLTEHTPDARALLVRAATTTFARRVEALAEAGLVRASSGREATFLMSGLYRMDARHRAAWIVSGLGEAPRTARDKLAARRLIARLSVRERWEEVATHLGELLVVLTQELPPHLPHARKILGDICFDAGRKYAERVRRTFSIDDPLADAPRAAMEVLRMSEYVFRVNPEHWSESDGERGWLEGTACPWWSRPGWNGAHCGIFGQFQSGIASAFGLRYHLTKTIPRHGGHTCRIDVRPIELRRKPTASPDAHT
ncbi:MAG: hypothetical protein KC657_18155 [Myxococcales bacterium]|nr:hypothetical protein [Myxococcales bacterium]